MKFQLVILSALLVSAFALPVPDEEVSPIVQSSPQGQDKSVDIGKLDEKVVVDAVKPAESRATEDKTAAVLPATKIDEKKEEKLAKPELAIGAPDAEIAQSLPELKEDKKDKQTRAEDIIEEVKALPVVNPPVAAVEEQKQVVEEAKAIIEPKVSAESKPSGVAEIVPSEQKKEELSAAEETPVVKSDAAPIAETKKEETPARQERVGEAVNEVDAKISSAAAANEGASDVKSLKPKEAAAPAEKATQAEKLEKAEEPKEQLKAAEKTEKKSEPALLIPAGDIPQQVAEETSIKSVKAEPEKSALEGKKIEEPVAAAVAAETPAEKPQEQKKEIKAEAKESESKILEEKKPAEEQKLSESKKSEETKDSDSSSAESKESGESKEEKSNEDKSN